MPRGKHKHYDFSQLKIEKRVPLPKGRYKVRGGKDVAMKMKTGDSCHVKSMAEAKVIYTAARAVGLRFIFRQEGSGYRVWHAGKRTDVSKDAGEAAEERGQA